MSAPLPPKLNPNCQCICHYQSGVMHVVACCHAPVADLAQASVAAAICAAVAAANARADQARDAALVEAADIILADNYDDPDTAAHAIIALRDKPAPGLTPKIEVKFTWAKGDEEFWVHLKSPDGKSAGFNLGNPKGMIATALLRAIAGGGDE